MKIQLTPSMRMQLFFAESLEIELPEGWVLVPKQATPTMIAVGQHADDNAPALCDEQVERVWQDMVTIAQMQANDRREEPCGCLSVPIVFLALNTLAAFVALALI